MIVSELIEQLKNINPNLLVVASRDEEGNGFTELRDVATNHMFSPSEGEVFIKELTPELKAQGYGEEDVYGYHDDFGTPPQDGIECVVLWP